MARYEDHEQIDIRSRYVNVSNRITPKKKNVSRVVELIGIVS